MINYMEWIVTSSLLIIIVVGLRALMGKRISLRWRYAFWLVVAVRLIVPFSIQGTGLPMTASELTPELPKSFQRPVAPEYAGVRSDIPLEYAETSGFEVETDGTVHAIKPEMESYYPVLSEDKTTVQAYSGGLTWEDTLLSVWAGGAVVMAVLFLGTNLSFAIKLCRRRVPVEGVEGPLPVYRVEGIPSPCLFGLFPPAIYLTPEGEREELREHVLAHELTHYAHGDHIWSLVRCVCLAVHWFNPLVWLAVALSKRDSELACDEGAVARLGEEQRIAYGRTLVNLVAHGRGGPRELLSCSTAMKEGEKTIQQRIWLLVNRPETRKTALFAAVAVMALAAVFVFSGEQGSGDKYTQYRAEVKAAESIRISMPIYSSFYYHYAIEDEDLLREAKELLLSARDLMTPVEEDFQEPWLYTYGLQLSPNAEEESEYKIEVMPHYQLHAMDSGCYVVYWENEYTYAPVAVLPAGTHEDLLNLMSEQNQRSWAEQGFETEQELTEEELQWFQEEFFNGDGLNIHNRFLTSTYSHPTQIDLYELFYLGGEQGGSEPITPEEERAVILKDYGGVKPDCACIKITREEMDRILFENTAYGLFDMVGTGLEKFTYLPEYDAYYIYRGDTNYPGKITLDSGSRVDNYFFLNYGPYSVTLHQSGDNYHFMFHEVNGEGASASSRPGGQVNDGHLAPVKETVNKMLQARYRAEKQDIRDYNGIELTSFQRLGRYDDLLKDSTVSLYSLDFGLHIDDLTKADWTDGSWVDYDGLFHPYTHQPHLIVIENGEGRQFYDSFEWEHTLKEGAIQVSGNPVEQADILNILVNRLADWLPQVSFLGGSVDQQLAERYGQILAQFYYMELGEGHPNAVRDAQFVSAEVYEQEENGLCAWISLAVDPLEPNSSYWMAGNGIEPITQGEWAGYWLHSLAYRLELQNGIWICTDRGTGGVQLEK